MRRRFGIPALLNEQVDAAELGLDLRSERGDRVEVADVEHPHPRVGCERPTLLEDLGEPVLAAGADADGRAFSRERDGECGADTRRRAGDERARPCNRIIHGVAHHFVSFDRDRRHHAAHRVRERQRRRVEEHRVAAVVGAVGGEVFEVEVLALRHPHVDEVEDVHGSTASSRSLGNTSKW